MSPSRLNLRSKIKCICKRPFSSTRLRTFTSRFNLRQCDGSSDDPSDQDCSLQPKPRTIATSSTEGIPATSTRRSFVPAPATTANSAGTSPASTTTPLPPISAASTPAQAPAPAPASASSPISPPQRTTTTTITSSLAPAVTHEVHHPHVTHIHYKQVSQEIHEHTIMHYVQPVIDVEVLPTRHYIQDEPGGELREVDAEMVPRLTGRTEMEVRAEDARAEMRAVEEGFGRLKGGLSEGVWESVRRGHGCEGGDEGGRSGDESGNRAEAGPSG